MKEGQVPPDDGEEEEENICDEFIQEDPFSWGMNGIFPTTME